MESVIGLVAIAGVSALGQKSTDGIESVVYEHEIHIKNVASYTMYLQSSIQMLENRIRMLENEIQNLKTRNTEVKRPRPSIKREEPKAEVEDE